MRMRKKPWSKDIFTQYEDYYMEPSDQYKGQWKNKLKSKSLRLEIGAGKGDYWHGLAKLYPQAGVIAIERDYTASSIALRKLKENPRDNQFWILGDAVNLLDVFAPNELDVIHLNFSDPWPKKRHHKRRLTYKTQLDIYHTLLNENGEIWFKTDNRKLFNDSVIYFDQHKFDLIEFDVDFRCEEQIDPFTEYERKFTEMGMPIYRGVWRKNNNAK
ncbi:tRNA (guanosine(46)-N7)-methyltransferase TrmB [Erysipelothrix urinaevulpis]|uniref:tRNA (guanosine(46)-N7)-methyltransferase TrmB n=1 Tax=Erysipelothrix urinaevulpis TaxID=2683717 RepID=UPI001356B5A6|nr:tRNA (guanosine(46)-N7)-methyltransferase TrmB [Erysipelothrix urinaevulpis]